MESNYTISFSQCSYFSVKCIEEAAQEVVDTWALYKLDWDKVCIVQQKLITNLAATCNFASLEIFQRVHALARDRFDREREWSRPRGFNYWTRCIEESVFGTVWALAMHLKNNDEYHNDFEALWNSIIKAEPSVNEAETMRPCTVFVHTLMFPSKLSEASRVDCDDELEVVAPQPIQAMPSSPEDTLRSQHAAHSGLKTELSSQD